MNKIYKLYARIFAKSLFLKWNIRLLRFALSGLGILNFYDNQISGEKYFIEKILPNYLGYKPVIFDVGANIGNYSRLLLNNFRDANLHLFEPHPSTFQVLIKNIDIPNATCNNMGLNDSPGEMVLYDKRDDDGSTHASIYRGVIEKIHGKDAICHTVRMDTIESYCTKKNIDKIDFLKVDVEGNEMKVLQGAGKFIRTKNIKIIHFEFNEMNVESRTFLRDFFSFLDGYSLYRMLPHSLLPLNNYRPLTYEIFAFQNIVAIDNEINKKHGY